MINEHTMAALSAVALLVKLSPQTRGGGVPHTERAAVSDLAKVTSEDVGAALPSGAPSCSLLRPPSWQNTPVPLPSHGADSLLRWGRARHQVMESPFLSYCRVLRFLTGWP